MICKNCGNVISNGTYCIICGTENDEAKLQEYNEIMHEKERQKKKNTIIFALVALILYLVITVIVIYFLVKILFIIFSGARKS